MSDTTAQRKKGQAASNGDLPLSAADERIRALEAEVAALREREAAALDRQAAMAEVLGIISRSAADVQPVLDAIVGSAARLCDAEDCSLWTKVEGGYICQAENPRAGAPSAVAAFDTRRAGLVPAWAGAIERGRVTRADDVLAEAARDREPWYRAGAKLGIRSAAAVPLVRDGVPFGALTVNRYELRPFSEAEVALLQTFADQAVIAIENARLFNELQDRNRDVTEALERQSATADVLQAISRSAFDVQTVLQTLTDNAARLLHARWATLNRRIADGSFALATTFGMGPDMRDELGSMVIDESHSVSIAARTREPVTGHITPDSARPDQQEFVSRYGEATGLNVPLLSGDDVVGTIGVVRPGDVPFSHSEVALLQTFADQAVIAIENARLFNELQGSNRDLSASLERQSATSAVLEAVARAPGDVQSVLQRIVLQASQLAGATGAAIHSPVGGKFPLVAIASGGSIVGPDEWYTPDGLSEAYPVPQVFAERRRIHLWGGPAAMEQDHPDVAEIFRLTGNNAVVATPLLGRSGPLGVLVVSQSSPEPFDEASLELLQTFADQAVIAIENARLFDELQDRNSEVTEALDQQTALADVLGAVGSARQDLQPVWDVITSAAARLLGEQDVAFSVRDGDSLEQVASYGPLAAQYHGLKRPVDEASASGTAMLTCEPVHIEDMNALPADRFAATQASAPPAGIVTALVVPMVRNARALGAISFLRAERRPFTAREIALVQQFANQAAIAVDNAGLLEQLQHRNREVTEALDRQTAMADVLQVISSSPTALDPVLLVIAETTQRLLKAETAVLFLESGGALSRRATTGRFPWTSDSMPLDRGWAAGRAFLDRKTVHVDQRRFHHDSDLRDDFAASAAVVVEENQALRLLATPLLRDASALGVLVAVRASDENAPDFTLAETALIETFAAQAVIAIENARLFNELQDRNREVTEALTTQAALAEVLGVISRSPTDVGPVLDAITEAAWRLFDVPIGALWRPIDGMLEVWSGAGPDRAPIGYRMPFDSVGAGEAFTERRTVNLRVSELDETARHRYDSPLALPNPPERLPAVILAAPLLRGDDALGVLAMARWVDEPFSDRQAALLEAFADQAVIAIENARLFNELQDRNREVTEALDRQTAMADVLEIISRSATDAQPVLDAVCERAAVLSAAEQAFIVAVEDGLSWPLSRYVAPGAIRLPYPEGPAPIARRTIGAAIDGRQTVEFHGTLDEFGVAFPEGVRFARSVSTDLFSIVCIPLLRAGEPIGVLQVASSNGIAFTPDQVILLEAFADQAVIAIENARLFNELQGRNREVSETLEQQTAMAEVLTVMAQSPSNLHEVLQQVTTVAANVCGGDTGSLNLIEGDLVRRAARIGTAGPGGDSYPLAASRLAAEAMREGRTMEFYGSPDEFARRYPDGAESMFALEAHHTDAGRGVISTVSVPMKEPGGSIIGQLQMRRSDGTRFSNREKALLEAFADQAVIAIENARLFNELQDRNREVTEALDQQRAMAEVLEIISRSTVDAQPVLDAVVKRGALLCNAQGGQLLLLEGTNSRIAARYETDGAAHLIPEQGYTAPIVGRVAGATIERKETIHLWGKLDAFSEFPATADYYRETPLDLFTCLSVPLLREQEAIGCFQVGRVDGEPFSAQQIALLEAFADQAVIAIENARLFHELQDSNASLGEALGEQTRLRQQETELLQTVSRQAEELRDFNRELEGRVAEGVSEVERLRLVERFVAPSLAEAVAAGGDAILESHRREIAVLFSDLRGYTNFSSTAEPEDVMTVLNELHAAVGPLVFEHHGTLAQFTGDGMMILFNDPVPCDDPAWRAVQLAIAMRACVAGLTEQWARRGHELEMGVGVAIGYATCGRVGFEGRYEYTAIGTVVNLASRLCGVAKGGQILVSQRVQSLLGDRIDAATAGDFELKGFPRPVPAFALEA